MKHPIIAGVLAAVLIIGAAVFIGSTALAAECGSASWYGPAHHGKRTASGAIYDQWAMTAARPSRSELGRVYRVTHDGKSVKVRITDTGGFAKYGRIIDLSRGAARKLGMEKAGVGRVCIERLK